MQGINGLIMVLGFFDFGCVSAQNDSAIIVILSEAPAESKDLWHFCLT